MRPRRPSLGVLSLCLVARVFGGTAEAAEFHCAAGDVPCLIDSINASNQNGEENTIHLEAGTYPLTAVLDPADAGTGLPTIAGAVAIVGAGADATIIARTFPQGQGPSFRIFRVGGAGRLQLARVTITGGSLPTSPPSSLGGGAILSNGTVSISDSVISGNRAFLGGAILIRDGGLSLTDSRIINNLSPALGVVVIGYNPSGLPPTGAARIVSSLRTSISSNACCNGDFSGSIVQLNPGWAVTIRDSAIDSNFGLSVGAALGGLSGATITNTSITNNNIVGAVVEGQDVTIANSTIADNLGGLRAGPFRLQNTILAGNGGSGPGDSDCRTVTNLAGNLNSAIVVSLGHNLFGNPAGCGDLQPGDLTGSADLSAVVDSGRPGGRYYPLSANSQAIDAGDPAACPEADQRGLARNIDGNGDAIRGCDIGAVEFYPTVNDSVQLEGLQYSFVTPSRLGFVDPHASAGAYRITAFFRNTGPDLCHVAFDVPALNGPTGTNPVLLTNASELLGGQGAAVSAEKAGAPVNLPSGTSASYQFSIGVQQRMPINFMVNILGDATSGACAP